MSKKLSKTYKNYCYSFDNRDGDRKFSDEVFISVDETLKAAKKDNKSALYVWIGEMIPYDFNIDTDELLEKLDSKIFNDGFDQYETESYFANVSQKEKDALNTSLNQILKIWITRNNLEPKFGDVINAKKYRL